jgi:DNA-binding CsgD family transcriptional regulator
VPWRKVHNYLLQVESCETTSEFMHTACAEVEKLIHFDAAAGIWSAKNGTCLEVVGPPECVPNSYYAYCRIRQLARLFGESKRLDQWDFPSVQVIRWRTRRSLKYGVDFMIPGGLSRSFRDMQVLPFPPLAELPGQQIVLAIFRTRLAPDFTGADRAILDVLNQHLGKLFAVLNRKTDLPDQALSVHAITKRFRSLSQREAELCCLLARRLNTAEIAEGLFISRRTVEKHIDNIFDKLHVRSRTQLRTTLGMHATDEHEDFPKSAIAEGVRIPVQGFDPSSLRP